MTEDRLRQELARVRQRVLPKKPEPQASVIRKRLAKADRAIEFKDVEDIKINFLLLTTIV